MFSQKTSLAKSKTPTVTATNKKTTSINSSPAKNSAETKPSTASDKTDHPGTNLANQLKDVSKVAIENGTADPNTGVDFNASELSIIKLLEGDNYKEHADENKDKKLLEENANLRKDMAMKNNLIERLMKENSDLRKEMDELLSTVENAKDKIDSKLKVCNDRIQELEQEIKHVKDENSSYSEEVQRLRKEKKSSAIPGFEEHITKYYHESQEQIESFYQHMTLKLNEFMHTSKEKHDQINTLINSNNRTEENKKEAPKPQGRASVPNHIPNQSQTHMKNRPSTSRLPTYTAPPSKSKTISGLAINQTPTPVDRVGSLSASNRRKKNLTLHDLDDVNQANTSDNASSSTDNKNGKKSPTGGGSSGTKSNFFTPKGKAKVSFKPTNICYTEGDKN